MSNKYYVLEKNTFEGLSLKLPTEQFDESVLQCNELGVEPFTYDTIDEAQHVRSALNLIFKGKSKSTNFIIVKEVINE